MIRPSVAGALMVALAGCADPGLEITIDAEDQVRAEVEQLQVRVLATQGDLDVVDPDEVLVACDPASTFWSVAIDGEVFPKTIIVHPGLPSWDCVVLLAEGVSGSADIRVRQELVVCDDFRSGIVEASLTLDDECLDRCGPEEVCARGVSDVCQPSVIQTVQDSAVHGEPCVGAM